MTPGGIPAAKHPFAPMHISRLCAERVGIMCLFRRIACAALLLCIVLPLAACAQSTTTDTVPELTPLSSFHDIPGITPVETAAIESLIASHERFSFAMMLGSDCFYDDNGVLQGFSPLVCAWLSDIFGVPFDPVIVEWDELQNGLRLQEYDFTSDTPASWRDENGYFMTDAIAERSIRLFLAPGVNAETSSLRCGYLEGSVVVSELSSLLEPGSILVPVANLTQANNMLLSGDIDAFIGQETAEPVITAQAAITTIPSVTYNTFSIATRNPAYRLIISAIQKYLESGGGYELNMLEETGNYLYLRRQLIASLTDEERAYLAVHQNPAAIIPVGIEFDNYPYSFYNAREGQWQGISVDLLAEMEKLTGMHFGYINSRNTDWATILSMLKSGEFAMTTELIRTPEREGQFLWAEAPYVIDNYALLSLSEYPNLNPSQVPRARVGLVIDTAYAEAFHELYPNHAYTVEYETTLAAFDALERGEVDLVMMARNLLLSATNYLERTGIKENLLFDRRYSSHFGFNINQQILCSIISKAQRMLDVDQIATAWTRKVFDYRGKLARAQVPYLIGAAVLMLCVLVLLMVLLLNTRQMGKRLAVTVAQRTEELKKRTDELEVQTETAQIASRAKSNFLARMSHEIRTPLNAIVGMTEIARRSVVKDPGKATSSLGEISTASSHLMGIINDVLDMSKIESGKFKLSFESFALMPAMREVTQIIQPRCTEKNLAFIVHLDEAADLAVSGDRLRLNQVLINLLGNAVKFTGDGGSIHFTVDRLEDGGDEAVVSFTITDSGIGMTDEQKQKLFRTFEQADDTIATRFGGTGLGLAISQSLVAQMGGLITVESQIGKGSTFTFTLHMAKTGPIEDLLIGKDDGMPNFAGKRILLVEDIELNRMIVTELLAETQLDIDTAEDGAQALAAFDASEPGYYQLIFMDIQMPNMNGYESTRHIRALNRPDAAEVPIIAMTANAYREDIDNALSAGMNGHLSKPINIDDIITALRRWL